MRCGIVVASAITLAALAGACAGDPAGERSGSGGGGAGGGGAGGASGGSLEDDYCAPLAAFVCRRASACGCGGILPAGSLDERACVDGYLRKCLEAYAPVVSAIASGQAHILKGAASACIGLLDASTPSCERPRGVVAQALCPAWFSGGAALGEACSFPICAEGAGICKDGICVARPGEGASCGGPECAVGLICGEGLCAAPKSAGDACAGDDACAPPMRCIAGACAALAPVGGACASTGACALGLVCEAGACADAPPPPCQGDAACGNQAFCASPRRCQEKVGDGAACDTDEACQSGSGCDPAAEVCAPYPGAGAPCQGGALCGPGLACATDFGVCAAIPGEGAPCGFGSMGPTVCQDGLGCVAGTCASLPGAGQPCTTDSRCAPELGCDFTPDGSVCGPLKDAGGSCQTDRTCKPGLHCDLRAGACASDFALGAPCRDGNECGPAGVCLPGSGGAFVCAPTPGLGDRCLYDCQSSLHCAADPADTVCANPICLEL